MLLPFRNCLPLIGFLLLVSPPMSADIIRYKTEASYLEDLSLLTNQVIHEGFESSAWDDARSPDIFNRNGVAEKIHLGMRWQPAAKDVWGSGFSTRQHLLTTNHNWARSGQWGLFEDHQGEGFPTTIRVSSETLIFGIGAYFDTNPDFQSVGFLFEDRTTAQDPGYYLPGKGVMYPGDNPSVGPTFVGLIDTEGFHSVVLTGTLEITEDGVLEGGTIFGADDFTIGVAAVPEPGAGTIPLLGLLMLLFRRKSS